jgi:hypothetical protein
VAASRIIIFCSYIKLTAIFRTTSEKRFKLAYPSQAWSPAMAEILKNVSEFK